jgi:chromosome segregation ATPase
MHEKLSRAQASTSGDQAERVAVLTAGIATLERSLADLAAQVPGLQSDVEQSLEAQQPFEADIAQHDQELAELQAAQKAAVDPLAAQLSELQARVRAASERISGIAQQMKPLTVSLGRQVAQARPEAPALASAYSKVDRLSSEVGTATDEGDLLRARLAAVDAATLRKFYLLVGSVLVIVIVTAVLVFVR